MDATPITRARWRLRGAWMWPACIVCTVIDGLLLHERPVVGDSATVAGAVILAFILNLIAIVVIGPTLGRVIRRRHRDMPRLVSSDYAGALGVVMVTVIIAAGGVIHHHVVTQDATAESNAIRVAGEYIGSHAPRGYLMHDLTVDALQPPSSYRVCAAKSGGSRWYCVAVTVPVGDRNVRGANDDGARIRYSGSESNGLLSAGTN